MLLRNSISGTKKFFTKTLHSFKSFFFGGSYQKLHKTSPHHSSAITMNNNDLDNFYNEFNDRWSTNHGGARRRGNQKSPSVQSSTKQDGLFNPNPVSKKVEIRGKTGEPSNGETRNLLVMEQKLKGMEMMDISNVDHVLDIEEVLHYYSRLTCPAYIDIVDKFFLEIYAEFFASSALTPTRTGPEVINSNPKMECSVKS